MNYLAHALPFLDRPYVAAGTGVPDWLTVVDRQVRLRTRLVEPFLADVDFVVADVAAGALQHLRDDAHFHSTRTFMECNLSLTMLARDALGEDASFRPGFLGHLLTEVLLDATLAAEDKQRLEVYYRAMDLVDPAMVEAAVNRMAPRPTHRLAWMIAEFCRHRILYDYLDDGRLLFRVNQVMRRVGLAPLPPAFAAIFPRARHLVAERKGDLLEGTPAG